MKKWDDEQPMDDTQNDDTMLQDEEAQDIDEY
jgi:hypothetical protein